MADAPPLLVEDGTYDYDLVTIGVGSGGTRASRISAKLGAKVLAVELPYDPISSELKGGVGGTCVLRGCVPKKILMYGSSFRADFEDARGFGWRIPGEPEFDWKLLIANKTREIERLNAVYKRILQSSGVELIEGRGSVVDPHTVQVELPNGESKKFSAKYILLATGGRAFIPDIPGKELSITSDEALSLDDFPKTVAIIGGGYIAVEFAGIFSGMGSSVHLIYRQPLPLRGFDEEMRGIVASNLVGRGIQIHPNTIPTKIEKTEDGHLRLHFGQSESIVVDQVMFATGRKPNTSNLGLEKVGVELDSLGAVKVSAYSQTNVKSIWAVGDITDRINLTPVALMEGQSFALTVFGGEPLRPDHEIVPSAVFCQPPLSVVGYSEEEAALKSENEVLVFQSSFTPMKNTISGRKEKAFMKLLVDSVTNRVIGASMCGADAPEIMQSIAIAMKAGATKKHFDSTVGIHPSAAEEFVTLREPKRTIGGKK